VLHKSNPSYITLKTDSIIKLIAPVHISSSFLKIRKMSALIYITVVDITSCTPVDTSAVAHMHSIALKVPVPEFCAKSVQS
jgi:hypothetical protein